MKTIQSIFSAVLLLMLSACAQTSGVGVSGNETASGNPALMPFDDKLEALSPAYTGQVCGDIVGDVKKLRLIKDEFESTADYQSRVGQMANAGLRGQLRLSDTLAFVVPRNVLEFNYDADKAQMSGSFDIGDYSQLSSAKTEILSSRTLNQMYEGASKGRTRSASGIEVYVDLFQYRVCALNIANTRAWQRVRPEFNITADEARLAKSRLRILYVGHLVPQFIQSYLHVRSPSASRMTEGTYAGNALVFQLEQIWVFDQGTGRVYQKIKPSN